MAQVTFFKKGSGSRGEIEDIPLTQPPGLCSRQPLLKCELLVLPGVKQQTRQEGCGGRKASLGGSLATTAISNRSRTFCTDLWVSGPRGFQQTGGKGQLGFPQDRKRKFSSLNQDRHCPRPSGWHRAQSSVLVPGWVRGGHSGQPSLLREGIVAKGNSEPGEGLQINEGRRVFR